MTDDERRLLVLLGRAVLRLTRAWDPDLHEMSRLLDRVERAAEREAVENCR